MPTKKLMVCDLCGRKGTRKRRITRSYGHGSSLLVVEQVPVITCPHCGESYLTAVTLHELENIKRHRRELAATRPVAVANFR